MTVRPFRSAHAAWLFAQAKVDDLEARGWNDDEGDAAVAALSDAEWGVVQSSPPEKRSETVKLAQFVLSISHKYGRGGTTTGLEVAALNKLVFHIGNNGDGT